MRRQPPKLRVILPSHSVSQLDREPFSMIWNNWLSRWHRRPQPSRARRWNGRISERAERLEGRCLLTGNAVLDGATFLDANANDTFDDGDTGLSGVVVFLDVNHNGELDSAPFTASAVDTPVEIVDQSTATSSLMVMGTTGIIVDVEVAIDITHAYLSDLIVTLIAPNGRSVTLASGVGGNGQGFLQTLFDDEASEVIGDGDQAPFTGRFRPVGKLQVLDGISPEGVWTLEVQDTVDGDVGQIDGFRLSFLVSTEPTSTTDGNGQYQFESLEAGTYAVAEVLQPGLILTSPETSNHSVALGSGETQSGLNFGHTALPGTLHGQKWIDLNGDGTHQPEEPGSDGWTIEVLDAISQQVFTSTETMSIDLNDNGAIEPETESGLYSFENLPAGTYLIREISQPGWIGTFPAVNPIRDGANPVTQAGTYVATTPPTGSAETPADWLPDLIIDMENADGLRDVFIDGEVLRFGQATPNVGHGPLRIVGGADNGDGTQQVLQRIYSDQLDPLTGERLFHEREAGTFSFHSEHNHIHFNDFTRYALRATLPDADDDGVVEVGDIVRGGTKTSFCLIDISPYDLSLPNAASEPSGLGCDVEQQISVGWEDIYGSGTIGQELNIAGLPPGQYWLEAFVDPDNHFIELDETNNVGRILVTIQAAGRLHEVTLDRGDTVSGLDFGNFETVSLGGSVSHDANADGIIQPEEVGQAGVTVYIDVNGDHILNNPRTGDGVADGLAAEPWAITDSEGKFAFTGLGAGTFQVRIVTANDLSQTTETPASVSVTSGQDIDSLTFGIGVITGATTVVRRGENATDLEVADLSAHGQSDNLQMEVVGFGGPSPGLRVHDPDHVLQTSIGVQEGLHTVFVPLTELSNRTHILVHAGAGNDRVVVDLGLSPALAVINGGAGNDRLQVIATPFFLETTDVHDHATHDHSEPSGQNVLTGGAGNDVLIGSDKNDLLLGQDGKDSIIGNAGDDVLGGGHGRDTTSGGDGQDSTRWQTGDGADVVSDSEDFVVMGTMTADRFQLTVSRAGQILFTQAGRIPVTMTLNVSQAIIVNAGTGNDTLTASSSLLARTSVFLNGEEGDDLLQLSGTSSADSVLVTTAGLDPFTSHAFGLSGTERVTVRLRAGNDRCDASGISDAVVSLTVHGGAGHDTILGGAGDDAVNGGSGNDLLFGGLGNDRLHGGAGNDTILGGMGNDQIVGETGKDVLVGEAGNDQLNGKSGADTIVGGSGDNSLLGGAGRDLLIGGDDRDVLNGQGSQDRLFGGGGDNQFVRPAPGEIIAVFNDFHLEDLLNLL